MYSGPPTPRADTPSEPTAPDPSCPDPDIKPVTIRCGEVFAACCGNRTALIEPVVPTKNASSPSPSWVSPPLPASAMSSSTPSTSDNCRGLFRPDTTTTGLGDK